MIVWLCNIWLVCAVYILNDSFYFNEKCNSMMMLIIEQYINYYSMEPLIVQYIPTVMTWKACLLQSIRDLQVSSWSQALHNINEMSWPTGCMNLFATLDIGHSHHVPWGSPSDTSPSTCSCEEAIRLSYVIYMIMTITIFISQASHIRTARNHCEMSYSQ